MTNTEARGQEVVLVRHGATEWSELGRHTGRTDLDLTDAGRAAAAALAPALAGRQFALVLVEPVAAIAGDRTPRRLGARAPRCVADLCEWDYGDYEGRTTAEIRTDVPDWTVWTHPVPGGETAQRGRRADRWRDCSRAHRRGDVAIFSHGHALRVFGARWCAQPPTDGRILALDPASVCVLGYERETPVIRQWNWAPTVR